VVQVTAQPVRGQRVAVKVPLTLHGSVAEQASWPG
jgi:hypothetical protein